MSGLFFRHTHGTLIALERVPTSWIRTQTCCPALERYLNPRPNMYSVRLYRSCCDSLHGNQLVSTGAKTVGAAAKKVGAKEKIKSARRHFGENERTQQTKKISYPNPKTGLVSVPKPDAEYVLGTRSKAIRVVLVASTGVAKSKCHERTNHN